jgi:sugar O-acyltransferase (sialic acid O-acetyltransferase NeuD family)
MLIVGAKGFAKELLEILVQQDAAEGVVFFDNISADLPGKLYRVYPVIGETGDLAAHFKGSPAFALGIGGTFAREKLNKLMIENGGELQTIISPFARIGHFQNNIGPGCTIMTGVVITNDIEIGEGCLLNLNATVGHDTRVGKFCDIMPGVNISGNVTIGNYCSLGTGCVILPKVRIGNNVTVGAGSVVLKDIPDDTVVAGVPAKPLMPKSG